jgi:hypothetical protein
MQIDDDALMTIAEYEQRSLLTIRGQLPAHQFSAWLDSLSAERARLLKRYRDIAGMTPLAIQHQQGRLH